MHKQDYISLITQDLSNEITPELAKKLAEIKASDEDFACLHDDMSQIWEAAGGYEPNFSFDADSAFDKFAAKYELPYDKSQKTDDDAKPASRKSIWAIAILALFILSSSFFFANYLNQNNITNETKQNSELVINGTETILSPGSTIFMNKDESSVVNLEGNASFNIKEAKTISFGNTIVTASSSQLNVSKNADSGQIIVDVTKGSAKVNVHGKSYDLPGNNSLLIDPASAEVTLQPLDNKSNRVNWSKGRLSFDRTHLADVFSDMEQFFNISIETPDGVPTKCHFSAPYIEDVSPKLVFELLHASFNYQLRQADDFTYVVTNINCQ